MTCSHRGYERLPDLCGLSLPPYFVYGKFGLGLITVYTRIMCITGMQKKNQKNTSILKPTYDQKPETFFFFFFLPNGCLIPFPSQNSKLVHVDLYMYTCTLVHVNVIHVNVIHVIHVFIQFLFMYMYGLHPLFHVTTCEDFRRKSL